MPGAIRHQIQRSLQYNSGTSFWRFYTITSSTITTSAQNLTTAATGRLMIKNIVVKTDATGLAGGTNFVIASGNVKGPVNLFVETIANLGANITKSLSAGHTTGDLTTGNPNPTVTANATILEAGKRITYNNTAAVGTGAGTIDIAIQFEVVDNGATIT